MCLGGQGTNHRFAQVIFVVADSHGGIAELIHQRDGGFPLGECPLRCALKDVARVQEDGGHRLLGDQLGHGCVAAHQTIGVGLVPRGRAFGDVSMHIGGVVDDEGAATACTS